MKAAEVIEQYKNGRRDFRGESLRGCNFKNQELSGADFSGCDIRGANFSRANLTEAKFEKAKAGLEEEGVIILLLVASVLMLIPHFSVALSAVFIRYIFETLPRQHQIAGQFSSIFLICFVIVQRKCNSY